MKLLGIIDGTRFPLLYKVAFITNFLREPLLRRMEKEFGLIRPEWTVLICLEFQDNLNSVDICEITEQPSNTVSRAVSSLERKGLISRSVDPEDARRALLSLTKAGKQLHDQVGQIFVDAEAVAFAGLSESEAAELERLLAKVCADVPRWSAAPPFHPERRPKK